MSELRLIGPSLGALHRRRSCQLSTSPGRGSVGEIRDKFASYGQKTCVLGTAPDLAIRILRSKRTSFFVNELRLAKMVNCAMICMGNSLRIPLWGNCLAGVCGGGLPSPWGRQAGFWGAVRHLFGEPNRDHAIPKDAVVGDSAMGKCRVSPLS